MNNITQVKRGTTASWSLGPELVHWEQLDVWGKDSLIHCEGTDLEMSVYTSSANYFYDENGQLEDFKRPGLWLIKNNEIDWDMSDQVVFKCHVEGPSDCWLEVYSSRVSAVHGQKIPLNAGTVEMTVPYLGDWGIYMRWPEGREVTATARVKMSIRVKDEYEELAPGQLGVEYTKDGKVKLKAGMPNKSKWNELPYIGGEGSGAGNDAIIDVIELPEENINENGFYRLLTANFVVNKKIIPNDTVIHYVSSLPEIGLPAQNEEGDRLNWYYNMSDGIISSYIDETMSEAAANAGFNLPIGWYAVDKLYEMTGIFCDAAIILVGSLPKKGLPVTDITSNDSGLCVYYNLTDNVVYAYITDTLSNVASSILGSTVLSGWYPFETFADLAGLNYGGVIKSIDNASEDNALYVLESSTLYAYNNQWEPIKGKQAQSDWAQDDDTQPDYIWNKPRVAQADWNVMDESNPAAIKNKPFGDMPKGIIVYDGRVNCNSSFAGVYITHGTYVYGNISLLNGVTYKVTLDGVEWDEIVAENNRLQYSENTYFAQKHFQLFDKELNGEYHLRIIVAQDSSYHIDSKYLPSHLGIGKKGTADNAEIFNDYFNNTASGYGAHAEGNHTTASGSYTHAEGSKTTASGDYAHAEGCITTAEGIASHTEGDRTVAKGRASHAEGYETRVLFQYQHVQGVYNEVDEDNIYAHIVGNGTDMYHRSNAHTLDWDGNAWFAGDVYIGGTGQDDPNAKKLGAGANLLIVTCDEDTNQASHTATEIYNHVQNGGVAVLNYNNEDDFWSLQSYTTEWTMFGTLADDHFMYICLINTNGRCSKTEHNFLTPTSELITTDDIDNICGATLTVASLENEVTF